MRPESSPGMIPAYYFEEERLAAMLKEHEGEFARNQPFPHIVLDDFLPPEIVRRLIDEFPRVEDIPWKDWGAGRTRGGRGVLGSKLGQSEEAFFPPFIRHFLAQLNSATFIRFIERLTGVSALITDPSYSGCGLHSTGFGGRLMIHTDANRHPHSGAELHQILNFIVYLNEGWQDGWGGDLELWTVDHKPHRKISPIANRAVLFFTGTRSFHGHPEPLTCPSGRRRNSLAVYYYTYKRQQNEDYEGMQSAARWVPTTADDRAAAQELTDRGRAQLAAMAGSRIELPTTALRMPLEPQWGDRLLVTLLDGEGLDSATCDQPPATHLTPDTAGSNLRAFASVTPLTGEHGGDCEVVALLAEDGAVHLARKGETRTHFIGYIAAFLRILGRANQQE